MKPLIHIFTLSLILGLSCTTAKANNAPDPTVTPSPEKTIAGYFKFPSVLMPQMQSQEIQNVKVEVLFTTDKFGYVNFAFAKTSDQQLKQEIEKQFTNMKLPQLKANVAHSVTLNFKYVGSKY